MLRVRRKHKKKEKYRQFWEAKGQYLGAPPPEHLDFDPEIAGMIYELMTYVAEQVTKEEAL